jgi:hypothetical protein
LFRKKGRRSAIASVALVERIVAGAGAPSAAIVRSAARD